MELELGAWRSLTGGPGGDLSPRPLGPQHDATSVASFRIYLLRRPRPFGASEVPATGRRSSSPNGVKKLAKRWLVLRDVHATAGSGCFSHAGRIRSCAG